jgi:single-strand DNA-binding protein
MSSINKVILIGRLGADPELRYTADNSPVASFNMATSESWKDKGGNWQERTEWHRVVLWRDLANRAAEQLKKGNLVYIEGSIRSREYEGRDGVKRKVTEIVGNTLRILIGSGQGEGRRRDDAGLPKEREEGFVHEEEDDIPL